MGRDKYILVESNEPGCKGCALMDMCDQIADNFDNDEYMICAEEEDFAEFENPIYKEIGTNGKAEAGQDAVH